MGMKLAGKLISKIYPPAICLYFISCNFLLSFNAFDVFRIAFGAFQIRANAFKFLAAVIAHVFMGFHSAFKLDPERIAYAAHITSFLLILQARSAPTLLHISSSSSPGILFMHRSFIISTPCEVNFLLIACMASRPHP